MRECPTVKLLLVEASERDSVFVRNLLSAMTSLRPRMNWARTVQDARELLCDASFDLLLVDADVCHADTLAVLSRAVAPRELAPVILLGDANPSLASRETALLGAADYVSKHGLETGTLERSIRYVLRQPRPRPLGEAEPYLQATLDALSHPLALLAKDGKVLVVNQAWRSLMAREQPATEEGLVEGAPATVGSNIMAFFEGPDRESRDLCQGIQEVLQGARDSFEKGHCGLDSTSGGRWVWRAMRLRSASPLRAVLHCEEAAAGNSRPLPSGDKTQWFPGIAEPPPPVVETPYDALTGLAHREHLLERLDQATDAARRYDQPLSLCVLKIDGLGKINDAHGRFAGDRVLQGLAQILKVELRGPDLAGRCHGDELCALFVNTRARDASAAVARLKARFEEPRFESEDKSRFQVNVFFGLVDLTDSHCNGRELMRTARKVAQRALALGRSPVMVLEDEVDPEL